MLQKKILKGIRGFTTTMYMLADDIGLIDIESVYSDIDIITADEEIYIRARRPQRPEAQYKSYIDLFCSKVRLPCAIKSEEVKASFNNGLLVITLPKEVVTARTKISIE